LHCRDALDQSRQPVGGELGEVGFAAVEGLLRRRLARLRVSRGLLRLAQLLPRRAEHLPVPVHVGAGALRLVQGCLHLQEEQVHEPAVASALGVLVLLGEVVADGEAVAGEALVGVVLAARPVLGSLRL
jgi:hypothetical protein